MKALKYRISGKIAAADSVDLTKRVGLRAYAIRERKVVGSAPVERDGSFSIDYSYGAADERSAREPLGAYLVVGPDLPEDGILRTGLKGSFLEADAFKEHQGIFVSAASAAVMEHAFEKARVFNLFERICRTWRLCIQVQTCSSISSGLCFDEQDLANARVRIYEVRKPLIWWVGSMPSPHELLVAEGDTDSSGRFQHEQTICIRPYMVATYITLGYRVEVGQIIDGSFQSIYKDPADQLRTLQSGICEEIYIERADIVEPVDPEGLLTGDILSLTRIGNIPVGFIEQDPATAFFGYADSSGATDSATLKVKDSAFGRVLKLYANIGSGLFSASGDCEMKHFRLKYTYDQGGAALESHVQVPFNNLRASTSAESATMGPYVTEKLGPVPGPDGVKNVYRYPNPYDFAADAQWVYRGLIMVLDTRGLPLTYGRFTLTVEPLDDAMAPLAVSGASLLSCTLMVDNTAPSATIGDIVGPYGVAPACGFLELDLAGSGEACDHLVRNRLSGSISVPFDVRDARDNLWQIVVSADYGDVCDADIVMQVLSYTDTSVVPASDRPHWGGGSFTASSTGRLVDGAYRWDQCAYQFQVRAYKRVSNGEIHHYWWDFTKHVTIMAKAPGS